MRNVFVSFSFLDPADDFGVPFFPFLFGAYGVQSCFPADVVYHNRRQSELFSHCFLTFLPPDLANDFGVSLFPFLLGATHSGQPRFPADIVHHHRRQSELFSHCYLGFPGLNSANDFRVPCLAFFFGSFGCATADYARLPADLGNPRGCQAKVHRDGV